MTDKEAIEIIKVAKAEVEWEYPMEYAAAFDRAIEALEKCQKIEKIIKSWKDGTIEEKDSIYAFHKIIGVVEDGNDKRRKNGKMDMLSIMRQEKM